MVKAPDEWRRRSVRRKYFNTSRPISRQPGVDCIKTARVFDETAAVSVDISNIFREALKKYALVR
jgi:hypothetical protein